MNQKYREVAVREWPFQSVFILRLWRLRHPSSPACRERRDGRCDHQNQSSNPSNSIRSHASSPFKVVTARAGEIAGQLELKSVAARWNLRSSCLIRTRMERLLAD